MSAGVLKIVHYPDPVLREKAKPVEHVTDELRLLAEQMLQLMRAAPGVGLAAPQVGKSVRLFVANPTGEPGDDEVYINPEVQPVDATELEAANEGCLSLPEIRGEITRPKHVRIRYLRLDGTTAERDSDELLGRIWQHETDHLDGKMIIDRMPAIDKMAARKKLKELEAEFFNGKGKSR